MKAYYRRYFSLHSPPPTHITGEDILVYKLIYLQKENWPSQWRHSLPCNSSVDCFRLHFIISHPPCTTRIFQDQSTTTMPLTFWANVHTILTLTFRPGLLQWKEKPQSIAALFNKGLHDCHCEWVTVVQV